MTTAVRAGPRRTIQTDSGASASGRTTTGTSPSSFPRSYLLPLSVSRLVFFASRMYVGCILRRRQFSGSGIVELSKWIWRMNSSDSLSLPTPSTAYPWPPVHAVFSTLLHEDF
jgi:hypothetical protein